MASPLPVRVLFVEDSADDVELLVRTLTAGGFDVGWERVEDGRAFQAALDGGPWDVILCDFLMPHFGPDRALAELQARGADIPLLVVSGAIDERTAVALMRAGARDYVLKDNLARLVPAVTRELRGALARHEGRQAHHALRRSESFFRTIVEHASDVIAVTDLDGQILHIAPSVQCVLGLDAEALIGGRFLDLIAEEDRQRCEGDFEELHSGRQIRIICEARFPHAGGSTRVLECIASRFKTPAGDDAIAVNARDVTDRREQERALRETSARLGILNAVARASRFGAAASEIVSRTLDQLAEAFPGMHAVYSVIDENNFIVVQDVRGPVDGPRPEGRSVDLSLLPELVKTLQQGRVFAVDDVQADARVAGVERQARDMRAGASAIAPLFDMDRLTGGLSLAVRHPHAWTPHEIATLAETAVYLSLALNEAAAQRDRRVAEAALRQSEAQLRQAQKMEAIGRLAGGVAHDFNNLLTAILGYGEIVAEEIGDHPAARDVEQILEAAQRAATLTRQLLTFSRQQLLEPQVFKPNEVIERMAQLIGRLIGDDVELALDLHADAGRITADRGQLEQVLMNLAVNARDAMPEGGRLRIATRSVVLDSRTAAARQVVPGGYVQIEVSDTGTGMDAATMGRIFEPFFTTKQKGQGTGLGLATVYGIVTQSAGGVEVESAEGMGTTFSMYFPRTDEVAGAQAAAAATAPALVVLILESDAVARTKARKILSHAGHTLLEAATLDKALALGERNAVDVLLMGPGAEDATEALRDALRARLPRLRVARLPPYPFSADTLLQRVHGGTNV